MSTAQKAGEEMITAVIDGVVARLRAAGCVYAEDEATLLVEAADSTEQLERLLQRRVAGEPLEQVLGWAEFCGMRLAVAPGVFVPRSRTQLLVREAVVRCRPEDVLVDLCCGVGAIAAAVLQEVQPLELYGTDVDPAAIACARRNLGPRAAMLTGDLFDPLPPVLRGGVAVITANAPYVPTAEITFMPAEARDHEARAALDGGPDGLDVHRRIIAEAPAWLAPGGAVIIETGREQAQTDLGLLGDAGLAGTMITDDEIDGTVVVGVRA